jgi:peptide/nickel transport system substrate-binding protein
VKQNAKEATSRDHRGDIRGGARGRRLRRQLRFLHRWLGAGYGAADTSIVNPQSGVGGTLNLEMSTTVDTLDSGVTYEGVTWDLYQLFDRTMMSYAQEPGSAGLKLVPDLATSWSSLERQQTWTYHIQPDAKFSDGDPIITKDVAYAIERSNFDSTQTVYGGPGYFAT